MLEWAPRTMPRPLLNPSSELLTSLRQTRRGCFGHFSVSILLLQLEAGTQNMPNWWGWVLGFAGCLYVTIIFFFGIWLCMWSSIVPIFFSLSVPVSDPALFVLWLSSFLHILFLPTKTLEVISSRVLRLLLAGFQAQLIMDTLKIKHLLFNLSC